ncbi:hypothetical protein ZIOFF_072187 [Zingiber officinale]|uniref:MAR-binding filament-like protein 1 n=2 Tax=Zingiber officinale TaxID=94328 RepID=A0A8J5EP91_ZINOF|nr:hypothetical protein ZIOFF_072187 [Zingiber officinale]
MASQYLCSLINPSSVVGAGSNKFVKKTVQSEGERWWCISYAYESVYADSYTDSSRGNREGEGKVRHVLGGRRGMPTTVAVLSRALLFPRLRPTPPPPLPPPLPSLAFRRAFRPLRLPPSGLRSRPRPLVLVAASLGSSFDEIESHGSSSKNSIILNLVQEIEPLDVSLIQKDVPANTVDAMKRTISGMLGLLPSDQFQVHIEALWEPLFKLLISSMKTGYTLRSAEYRLYLERNLDIIEDNTEKEKAEILNENNSEISFGKSSRVSDSPGRINTHDNLEKQDQALRADISINNLGELTTEVQEYISYMQSRINLAEKELHDIKRRNSALQMQQFVGEEKNDLLDYLRSLQPEKVAELSEPTCPGVEEAIHSIVHGLLATLSPKMHSKPPYLSDNPTSGTLGVGKDDHEELVENTSTQFQPIISIPRDYLARLLFWCMLMGHYIRGLEYRLELMELLTIPTETDYII